MKVRHLKRLVTHLNLTKKWGFFMHQRSDGRRVIITWNMWSKHASKREDW